MGEYLTKQNKNWEHLFLMKRTEDFNTTKLFEAYKTYVTANDFTQYYMEISEEDFYAIIVTFASHYDNSVIVNNELTFYGSIRLLSFTILWNSYLMDLYKDSRTGKCYISIDDTENMRYSTNIKYHHISTLRR